MIGTRLDAEDVNGNNTMWGAGSAYIFDRDSSGNWTQTQKIVASDRAFDDRFGAAVDIHEDQLVIGALNEDEDVNGNNTINAAGAAYVFKLDSTGIWQEMQKIVASDRSSGDKMGFNIAIYRDYIITAARYDSDDTTTINPMTWAGSAYIFEKNGSGIWIEKKKLLASDRTADDRFGVAVDVNGDRVLVGAFMEDHDTIGGNYLYNSGSAYVFERNLNGEWNEIEKLIAPDRDSIDYFGFSLGLYDDDIIVGAYWEDHDISGQNYFYGAGAAYMFESNCKNYIRFQFESTPIAIGTDTIYKSGDVCGDLGSPGYSSYLWSTGETTSTISMDCTPGWYTLTVKDSLGCNYTDSIYYHYITTGGFSNSNYEPLVFPNPFDNYVTVKNLIGVENISVFDLYGKLIYYQPNKGNLELTIDSSKWNKGIYFLKLKGKSKIHTIKLINN